MQFTIKKSVINDALSKVSRAISFKSPLPILTGIHFHLSTNALTLTGSNSDITIRTTITDDIDIEEIGDTVISSKYILEIIRHMDSDLISIDTNDKDITVIEGASSHFELNGSPASDYPVIDLSKKGTHVTIKSMDLKAAIDQTVFATSDKETRPVLTGVNFLADGEELVCIATDSYRLAKKTLSVDDEMFFNIVIPKKSLIEISRLITRDDIIDIYVEDKKIIFDIDNILIQTRLIDGKYPNISRLIPDHYDSVMSINSASLIGANERVSLLADQTNNIVKLTMSEEEVILSSFSPEIGSVEEKLDKAFYKGSALSVSFTSKYLIDAIKSINSETVKLQFTGKMQPFIIRDIESDDNIQVVLPVRTY
ncbi:MAG: DNA polymerase III subunit beta [Erysipelotrichaceae bacterium]|nr:DNA polymerase III subunit beta [Erysipelotrichaceae bacterium]